MILINFFIIEIISFTTLYFIAPHKNLELPYLKSDEAFKKYDPNLLYYMHDKLRWGQKRPFYSKKSKGDYLIYLLGGSTVEGEGVQDIKDSIAFQLEKKLNEKIKDLGLKIKVINEGISGY
ncbi:MAG: hypothetical protein OEY33_05335, partial [Bdellovibrionales bacterium]|nr:hypothetical protein [Bdellovibrionales bacterium]